MAKRKALVKSKALVNLHEALDTAAAKFFDKAFKVVFAVVIGDFFASLDVFLGHDKDPTAPVEGFTVWTTGMIGIACRIVARATINIPFGVDIEHIAVIALVALTRRDAFADVLDDGCPLLDRRQSKQSQSGFASLHFYIGWLLCFL